MGQASSVKIRRVDDALSSLIERRGSCDSPAEVIDVMESIDYWLDKRLDLMRDQAVESNIDDV